MQHAYQIALIIAKFQIEYNPSYSIMLWKARTGESFRRSSSAVATSREGHRSPRDCLLAQYSFNSVHDEHFEILLIVAIIIQLIHIVLEALCLNNPVVAFGMIVTA